MTGPKATADPNFYVPAAIAITDVTTIDGKVDVIDGIVDTIDANVVQVLNAAAQGYQYLRKVVAFDGGAGSGAVGTVALFTVTGAVAFRLFAVCTESLVSAGGGTISIGTAGTVDAIIAVTTATDIDIGELWFAAAPATVIDTWANAMIDMAIGDGADIQADVLVGDITDGTIEFTLFWTPLATGATVVAA